MKRILLMAATVVLVVSMAGIASAAVALTDNFDVTAQVIKTCANDATAAFPLIDIDTAVVADIGPVAPTTDQSVVCTNGATFTINLTSTNGTALDAGCDNTAGVTTMAMASTGTPADTVAYTMKCSTSTDASGTFTGTGVAQALGLSVTIPQAAANAAVYHTDYTDTVTVTINY